MDCIMDSNGCSMVILIRQMLVERRRIVLFLFHSFLVLIVSYFYYPKACLNFSNIDTLSIRLPANPRDSKNCSISRNSFSEKLLPSFDKALINILCGLVPLFVNLYESLLCSLSGMTSLDRSIALQRILLDRMRI